MDQLQPESAPRKASIAAKALFAATRWAVLVELRSTKVCSRAMDQAPSTVLVLSALVAKLAPVEHLAVKTLGLVSVRQVA